MAANVAITQDTSHPYSEADLRFNPADPSQIIAASNTNWFDSSGTSRQAQYYSTDGGRTWHQSSLPLQSNDSFASDPALDWTSDGTAWALTIGVGASLTVESFKSTDGGITWAFDSNVSGSESPLADKPSLWVDHSGSAHADNLYAIWHQNATAFVSIRDGPSGTWSTPLAVSGSETTFTADGGDIKTNGSGDVFAFWPNAGARTLLMAKSTNGGSSFDALGSSPTQIATTSGQFTIKIPAQDDRLTSSGAIGCLIYLTGGAYRTATEDLVYACWMDLAGGAGCNSAGDEPGGSTGSACKTRIWFSRSTNGGAHWEAAVKINDQSSKNDQFFPRLAVDDTTGNLVVIYYDTVNDSNRVSADIWMQSSVDNGVTWSPAVQVTTAATDEATGDEDDGQEFGDYIGLTVNAGRYFGCWTDRRGGGDEQIYGAALAIPDCELIIDKGTFGQDEVADQASWPQAYWLAVQGFTNEALGFSQSSDLQGPPNPAPSLSVSIDQVHNPTLMHAQIVTIAANLPTVDTFGPPPIAATDPSLSDEMQQFLYPYTISFAGSAAFDALLAHQVAVLTLEASLTVGPITVRTSAPIELAKGEDPYFTDVDPASPTAYPSWLSYDLRFFKVTPNEPNPYFSVPNPTDRSQAVSYIRTILNYLNDPSMITNGDTFDSRLSQNEDVSALEFLPANAATHQMTLNFVVARVRIKAETSITIDPVRVFFRLFQAASTVSTFAEVGTGQGTYRWGTNGSANHKIPLLGVQPDHNGNLEYVTIPCFASERFNLTTPTDMNQQTDPPNAVPITTQAGTEVDTYFGCWLDINQPDQTFLIPTPPTAQADWDGPWTGTQSVNGAITVAPHQCLIAEIRFDDTPVPTGATSSTSDKLAQRNVAWIDGPNPGQQNSRVMPHPFEVRASALIATVPDELMVNWGDTPAGSTASFYLPAVDTSELISLANGMYRTHRLRATDTHTIECPTDGVTFIPLPRNRANYAGLLAVTLPPGVRYGDSYDIIVRQLTQDTLASKQPPPPPPSHQIAAAQARPPITTEHWRSLVGSFHVTITISSKNDLLRPEESLLAWLKWRLSVTSHLNRWYPVLREYEAIVAGRVLGFGGDPTKIGPSASGHLPGGGPQPGHHEPGYRHRGREYTGKVIAVMYDRFGDFEGFTLITESGHEHWFPGREHEVEALLTRAWIERITVSVIVNQHDEWPDQIILRR